MNKTVFLSQVVCFVEMDDEIGTVSVNPTALGLKEVANKEELIDDDDDIFGEFEDEMQPISSVTEPTELNIEELEDDDDEVEDGIVDLEIEEIPEINFEEDLKSTTVTSPETKSPTPEKNEEDVETKHIALINDIASTYERFKEEKRERQLAGIDMQRVKTDYKYATSIKKNLIAKCETEKTANYFRNAIIGAYSLVENNLLDGETVIMGKKLPNCRGMSDRLEMEIHEVFKDDSEKMIGTIKSTGWGGSVINIFRYASLFGMPVWYSYRNNKKHDQGIPIRSRESDIKDLDDGSFDDW